jgi:hypothetical protein
MHEAEMTRASEGVRFGHAEVFASLALLSFLAARFLPLLAVPFTCPLRGMIGIPCATCGMTHAFVYLAHGRFLDAVASSPLGAVLAGGVWLLALADLARLALGAPLPAVPARLVRAAALCGVVALLVNWAYLVVREIAS